MITHGIGPSPREKEITMAWMEMVGKRNQVMLTTINYVENKKENKQEKKSYHKPHEWQYSHHSVEMRIFWYNALVEWEKASKGKPY